MSWLFSQALVGGYLVENSLDGEQSVQLSGKPTPQAYCAPDKMTDFFRLSRFGMTYKPLTESRGQELLMLYLEDFHAKTSQQQEKAQELMENDQECGQKWLASFVKYDPDSSSWKTHQCSLLGDLEPFSETWPRWGLMRDGECWEQQMSGLRINETESGLWPTPRSCSAMAATITPENSWAENRFPNLETVVGRRMFPTPQSTDYRSKPTSASWKAKGGVNFSLANPEIQAKWPTPDANCGQRGTQPNWTPKRKSGHSAQYTINQAVRDKMFPTPTAHNAKKGNYPSERNRNTPTLATHAGGKLNPMWVEWLMGWPLGWTDLKPLEMDKFHCAQQQHGES